MEVVECLSNSMAAPAEQEDAGRQEDVIDRLYPVLFDRRKTIALAI